jgi:hypothetical protein
MGGAAIPTSLRFGCRASFTQFLECNEPDVGDRNEGEDGTFERIAQGKMKRRGDDQEEEHRLPEHAEHDGM